MKSYIIENVGQGLIKMVFDLSSTIYISAIFHIAYNLVLSSEKENNLFVPP
jgi:hypothetical protein